MINELLRVAVIRQASDLHITVGAPPMLRLNGSLITMEHDILTAGDTDNFLACVTTEEQRVLFYQQGELDFSYAIIGLSRFRINAFRQRGVTAIVIRVIAEKIPSLEQLGHPEILKTLAQKNRGLVLVTGSTGSGKSTTLAAMIDLLNRERSYHIITLEDPIEYLHVHRKSIVNQREINTDTKSFAAALRAALREDPDIILVGEMRDLETIMTAITAAETGHLVLATLHTSDAAQTIERLVDVFPAYQQQQIRVQLALTLQGVIAQQLLPRSDGIGRVAALEILVATPAVRNLIREGKSHQLVSMMQTGSKFGMQTMDSSLLHLYQKGIVCLEDALMRATYPENFIR